VKASGRMQWLRTVIPFGVAYVMIGIVTAALAGSAASIQGRTLWRFAAWGVSLLVFGGQLIAERIRFRNTTLRSALHTSLAVAFGALALAAAGPVRSHWGTDSQQRTLIALLLWPVLTGLPSFLVALGAGAVLDRVLGRAPSASS
jgi:hypothetical protein